MAFIHEAEVYRLATRAGLSPPRHAFVEDEGRVHGLFAPGEPVVLKGIAEGLWHKSAIGAVAFVSREEARGAAEGMRRAVEAEGYRWVGGLVCERVANPRAGHLAGEALVSVAKRQGLRVVLVGLGGVRANALGREVAPLLWPVEHVSIAQAAAELEAHPLGRSWLEAVAGRGEAVSREGLVAFLEGLWALAELTEREGVELLEMNPVVLDPQGRLRLLDGVGESGGREAPRPRATGFWQALMRPARVAVAGVSERVDSPGHVILENLNRSKIETIVLKPGGVESVMGRPCVGRLEALVERTVDLLVAAVPAPAAVAMVEELIALGGGARVVGLVAGGIGDGADHAGLAGRLRAVLDGARRAGRWTPALVGPNMLGQVVPGLDLDTTFILRERWWPELRPGSLVLLSQSGAFLLSRLASSPGIRLGVGLALGNQLDVDVADVLHAMAEADADEEGLGAVAIYVEGFAGDALARTAAAARRLEARGRRVVLYRAGRTREGQAAAASHTGAVAGDLMLEAAVLGRVGVALAETMRDFEGAMRWLAAYPRMRSGGVAVVSNAGFETVGAADRVAPVDEVGAGGEVRGGAGWSMAKLGPEAERALEAIIARHGLGRLVSARLPLDLTPMATLEVYREVVRVLAETDASAVLIGIVPFSPRLGFEGVEAWAAELAALSKERDKAIAVVVDGGPDWEALRRTFGAAGLPIFGAMEDATAGLALAGPGPSAAS